MKRPNQVGGKLRGAGSERRSNARFPVTVRIRYASSDGEAMESLGQTVNLSTSGLSFTSDSPLAVGQKLQAAIDWPCAADQGLKVQLILSGVVVRAEGTAIALEIQRHEFQTRRAEPQPSSEKDSQQL
jgi:hypothetical protein